MITGVRTAYTTPSKAIQDVTDAQYSLAACPAAWYMAGIMQHEVTQLVLMVKLDCYAGLAMNSSVTVDALNTAIGTKATAIDSSGGGPVLVSSSNLTQPVDNAMLVLSGTPLFISTPYACSGSAVHCSADISNCASWGSMLRPVT